METRVTKTERKFTEYTKEVLLKDRRGGETWVPINGRRVYVSECGEGGDKHYAIYIYPGSGNFIFLANDLTEEQFNEIDDIAEYAFTLLHGLTSFSRDLERLSFQSYALFSLYTWGIESSDYSIKQEIVKEWENDSFYVEAVKCNFYTSEVSFVKYQVWLRLKTGITKIMIKEFSDKEWEELGDFSEYCEKMIHESSCLNALPMTIQKEENGSLRYVMWDPREKEPTIKYLDGEKA